VPRVPRWAHSPHSTRRAPAPRAANNIEEIRKLGLALSKRYGFAESVVAVSFVPDKFLFSVETTGALAPSDILDHALTALLTKLRVVSEACAGLGA
jgi:hypothetical protein